MTTFNIGDKVKIKPTSTYYGEGDLSNPANVVGEVLDLVESWCDLNIRVEWPEGYTNSYNESDLELVQEPKVKVGEFYKTKNSETWECIFTRGEEAWMIPEYVGAAYRWTLDGKPVCLSIDPSYELVFEPEVVAFCGVVEGVFKSSDTFFEGATHKFFDDGSVEGIL